MYYVMSDIHGSFNQFEESLKYWNPKKEHLVVIGDIINKGPDSLKVVQKLMQLKKDYFDKVIVTKGNHEDMLITWLYNNPYNLINEKYIAPYKKTVDSFIGFEHQNLSEEEKVKILLDNNKDELKFIESLPTYHESENVIFAHAGINLHLKDWKKDEKYMLWEKRDFIFNNKRPGKKVFFGHIPTNFIHNDKDNHDIWVSSDEMKIGIDGRVSLDGQLNAIKIDNKGNILKELKFK